MNFVTEAKRLGMHPPRGSRFSDEWDGGPDRIIALPGFETDGIREDDLCVDQCDDCRAFRSEVKDALAAEQFAIAEQSKPWYGLTLEEAFRRGRLVGAYEGMLNMQADIISQHQSDMRDLNEVLGHAAMDLAMTGLLKEVNRP